jgi:hypothetical protein
VTFVVFQWDGIQRAVPENDAKVLAEFLRQRAGLAPDVVLLAERIEAETERGTFAEPAQNIDVDDRERSELDRALASANDSGRLTHDLRALQTALHGERRPGEPGCR